MTTGVSSVLRTKMEILFKIAALLAAVAATSASRSLCSIHYKWELDCSGRGLYTPPPGHWPQITSLDLRSNSISELPTNSLSGFPALEYLTLNDNSFTKLNFEEFVNDTTLSNLSGLFIRNNEIDTLTAPPRGITLQDLRGIYASHNRISNLDRDFFSFAPNLQDLDISNNHLIVESGHPVLNHQNLQTLYMSFGGTGLNVVDPSLLAGLPNLVTVDFSSASISSVEGAFANNKNLWNILLQGNVITQISPGTFPSGGLITHLYLNRNPLSVLEPAALDNAISTIGYSKIDISDTPMACECRYEALHSWAKSKNISIEASCSGQNNCIFARPS